MEAGLEHLSWAGGTLRHVDLLLVVVVPTEKAMLTADRTHRLAVELGIPEIGFVANRSDETFGRQLEDFASQRGRQLLAVIPDDPAIQEADRRAVCVLDWAPDSPSVRAIEGLSRVLSARMAD